MHVHGALHKEDLIMMRGTMTWRSRFIFFFKIGVLICYPKFSTCSQKCFLHIYYRQHLCVVNALDQFILEMLVSLDSEASKLDFDMVNHCQEDGQAKSASRETSNFNFDFDMAGGRM